MRPDRPLRTLPMAAARAPGGGRAVALACCLLPLLAGCRHDMQNQNKVRPYRASVFYPDGSSARPLPAHTVAQGDLRADEAVYTGIRGGRPVADPPFPVTREVLRRGRERFDIFCSPCHGRVGDGKGMIVTRGYKQPTSFHDDRLRQAQVGWFFSVMTQGFGVMPSYAAQVSVADRWAIASYIRALQLSQGGATLGELPPAARQAIAGELAAPAAPGGPAEPATPAPSTESAPPARPRPPTSGRAPTGGAQPKPAPAPPHPRRIP